MRDSQPAAFRAALLQEKPLAIVGAINAYCAIMAEKVGFHALYLSGAGVANASYGIPDVGLTTLSQVSIDAKRIIGATSLPLLIDADTGLGDISETVSTLESLGAAAIQIEDQVDAKKCGQLDGKQLVSTEEMLSRIRLAIEARKNPDFAIMARTDAITIEGLPAALERAKKYIASGADMIFVEAALSIEDYRAFKTLNVPILANMTEFGKTPLYTQSELANVGVDMVLYPLSAFRAMNLAALNVYQTIKAEGTQQSELAHMQTRQALYDFLNYQG